MLILAVYLSKRQPIVTIETPKIIQAELIFVDTKTFLPEEEKLPEKVEVLPLEKPTELKQTAAIEPTEIEQSPPALEEQPALVEPELIEDEPVVVETKATEQVIDPAPLDFPTPAIESPKEKNNIYQKPIQDIAKSQLRSLQQSKLNSLAAQAASEYRQQRDHPKIGGSLNDSFLSEEERFEQKVTTSVDCSSTASQTVATVLGFMGGRVKCSEPPPFDEFIQKRLNKTAELPALQQQEQNKQY